jgi:hypothetical protein
LASVLPGSKSLNVRYMTSRTTMKYPNGSAG